MNTETITLNGNSTILGSSFPIWFMLQSGQEKIIRFSGHVKKFPQIRKQTGHEHCCSVGFLCRYILVKLRRYVKLDENLIQTCFQIHDVPEGILKRDVLGPQKKSTDDLDEYNAFCEHYKNLDLEVWIELHRSFLLQFALENSEIFPVEARIIMSELAHTRRFEAICFDGIQRFDYLYYAFECFHDHGIVEVVRDVSRNQVPRLDEIAAGLPGFGKLVWTPDVRSFFASVM